LVIGWQALGNELLKNLVLSGVGTVTILEHGVVTDSVCAAHYFVSGQDVGQYAYIAHFV
jgi:ubiquitin-like 1-activating enzyme E1 A